MSAPEATGPELDREDAKLVTLARSARVRTGAAEGAAVRDDTGRTYVAATVGLPSLQLSALRGAVAAAVSSGARALEAAAVVTAHDDLAPDDVTAVADLSAGVPIYVCGVDATVRITAVT